jgi:hypothetical protein
MRWLRRLLARLNPAPRPGAAPSHRSFRAAPGPGLDRYEAALRELRMETERVVVQALAGRRS